MYRLMVDRHTAPHGLTSDARLCRNPCGSATCSMTSSAVTASKVKPARAHTHQSPNRHITWLRRNPLFDNPDKQKPI